MTSSIKIVGGCGDCVLRDLIDPSNKLAFCYRQWWTWAEKPPCWHSKLRPIRDRER